MVRRVNYICPECGSSDVLLDAWAEWDATLQDWVLHDTLTHAYCRRCDGETRLQEVVLESALARLSVGDI